MRNTKRIGLRNPVASKRVLIIHHVAQKHAETTPHGDPETRCWNRFVAHRPPKHPDVSFLIIVGPFQAKFCMIFNDSWHRFVLSIVVFARSATHIAESAKQACQESAKNRQESPRARQEPYRSTTVPSHLLTFTRHNLQNESQPAESQMRGRRCLRRMASRI